MQQQLPDIMDQARGRWPGILSRFGIAPQFLTDRHKPCPMCGGRDRFRFDNKGGDGTYYCNQCGAGNGIGLLMKFKGWDFKTAAAEVRSILDIVPKQSPQRAARKASDVIVRQLWDEARPLAGSQAQAYLAARGLPDVMSPALRFHPRCPVSDIPSHSHAPAMIARIDDIRGEICAISRTYLDGDRKIEWQDWENKPAPARKFLGSFPAGCAVRLHDPVDERLGLTEGIESGLAFERLRDLPCWALLNTSLMEKWEPPAGLLQSALIGGDNDEKFGGQKAAFTLGHRLMIRKSPIPAEVQIPRRTDWDWLDVWNEHQRGLRN